MHAGMFDFNSNNNDSNYLLNFITLSLLSIFSVLSAILICGVLTPLCLYALYVRAIFLPLSCTTETVVEIIKERFDRIWGVNAEQEAVTLLSSNSIRLCQ